MKLFMKECWRFNMETWIQGLNIINYINKAGYPAYLVGGAVRDHFMGIKPKDIDIAADIKLEELSELYDKVIPLGKGEKTMLIFPYDKPVEITKINGESIEEDLYNRDFTCNAMAVNAKGKMYDPLKGKVAIQNKILVPVKAGNSIFIEDPLRLLRTVRLSVQLKFELSRELRANFFHSAFLIKQTAPERIFKELDKLGSWTITKENWENILPLLYALPLDILSSREIQSGLIEEEPEFTQLQWWAVLLHQNGGGWITRGLPGKLTAHQKAVDSYMEKFPWTNLDLYDMSEEVLESALLLLKLKREDIDEQSIYKQIQSLPIHSRRDLAADGKDLLFLHESAIGKKLRSLEEAVVNGKVANKKRDLINYIKGE
jgi:tRNA nucleotidyltransferase (CCA-adding enzyme)